MAQTKKKIPGKFVKRRGAAGKEAAKVVVSRDAVSGRFTTLKSIKAMDETTQRFRSALKSLARK